MCSACSPAHLTTQNNIDYYDNKGVHLSQYKMALGGVKRRESERVSRSTVCLKHDQAFGLVKKSLTHLLVISRPREKPGVALQTHQLVYLPGQRVQPGPSRVCDSSVSAETVIYEAFVLIGGNRVMLLFISFLEERECVEKLGRRKNGLVSIFPFLSASIADKPYPISPIITNAS